MIKINKHPSPRVLDRYRSDPNTTYDNITKEEKEAIRLNLLTEQGYLCAYCMSRIELDTSTIEHWSAQHPGNSEADRLMGLDYTNMLAVCCGNRGKPYKYQTCDAHKKNVKLTANPCEQETIDKISYHSNGLIYSDDAEIDHDLIETLNLNCEAVSLPQNRKSALDELYNYIHKECKKGKQRKSICVFLCRKSSEKSKKDPYWGIIEWKLNKWLSQD